MDEITANRVARAEAMAMAAQSFVRQVNSTSEEGDQTSVSKALKNLSQEGWTALATVAGLVTSPSPSTQKLTIAICRVTERLLDEMGYPPE